MNLHNRTNSPDVKIRTAIYMLIIPVLVFYVLAAVGCVSNSVGVPNIFNLSYRDLGIKPPKASEKSIFEIRTGYFGLCAGIPPEMACVPSIGSTAEQVIKQISLAVNAARSSTLSTPKVRSLLAIALENQKRTISWVILVAGFSFLLGLLSVLLLQWNLKKIQQKPNAGRKIMILKRMTLCLVWTSTALAFGASLTASQLAKTLRHTSHSSVSIIASSLVIEGGAGLHALQWLAASSSFFFSTGISLILSDAGESRFEAKGPSSFDDMPDF